MNEIKRINTGYESCCQLDRLPDETIIDILKWLPPVSRHKAGLTCRRLLVLANDFIFYPRSVDVSSEQKDDVATIVHANAYLIVYKINNNLSNIRIINKETGIATSFENFSLIGNSSKFIFFSGYEYNKKHLLSIIDNETSQEIKADLTEIFDIENLTLPDIPAREQYFQRQFFSKSSLCSIKSCIILNANNFITISKGGFIGYWQLSNNSLKLIKQQNLFPITSENAKKNFKEVANITRIKNLVLIWCAHSSHMQLNVETGVIQSLSTSFNGIHSSSQTNSHSVYTIGPDRILYCYRIDDLSFSWKANLEGKNSLYLLNDNWVFCGTSSVNPYEFIIFDARTGELITRLPIRNFTNLYKSQTLCNNHFISWNDTLNPSLKILHIPSQTHETIDLQPYVSHEQAYRISDAKYFNNKFYICIQTDKMLRFIEFRPKFEDMHFIGKKQARAQADLFYKMPWTKIFQFLSPKHMDDLRVVCREFLHLSQETLLNPKITSIRTSQPVEGFDFANEKAIGLRTTSNNLIIANRENGQTETISKAICLNQSIGWSYYCLSKQKKLLLLHHPTLSRFHIDLVDEAVSCLPVQNGCIAVLTLNGSVTIYKFDEKFKALSEQILTEEKISTVMQIGEHTLIQGNSNAKIFNLETGTISSTEICLIPKKTAGTSKFLFAISEYSVLNRYQIRNDNLFLIDKLDQYGSSYTIEEINERWMLCYKRAPEHSNVYIYNVTTGKKHLELPLSFEKMENLSGDYFISWNGTIITLIHLPTKRQKAIDIATYFPSQKRCHVKAALFIKNRLLVTITTSQKDIVHILELTISNQQIHDLFLRGIFSEAMLLDP